MSYCNFFLIVNLMINIQFKTIILMTIKIDFKNVFQFSKFFQIFIVLEICNFLFLNFDYIFIGLCPIALI